MSLHMDLSNLAAALDAAMAKDGETPSTGFLRVMVERIEAAAERAEAMGRVIERRAQQMAWQQHDADNIVPMKRG